MPLYLIILVAILIVAGVYVGRGLREAKAWSLGIVLTFITYVATVPVLLLYEESKVGRGFTVAWTASWLSFTLAVAVSLFPWRQRRTH